MTKSQAELVAVMEWHARKVLSWRVSNVMDTGFCIEALNEAINRYGPPEIFNSDQGAQFTSTALTEVLKNHNIRISMDGKGRWIDNVFIERLWRSVKYEEVYLNAYDSMADAKQSLKKYFEFYNQKLTFCTPLTSFFAHTKTSRKDLSPPPFVPPASPATLTSSSTPARVCFNVRNGWFILVDK